MMLVWAYLALLVLVTACSPKSDTRWLELRDKKRRRKRR